MAKQDKQSRDQIQAMISAADAGFVATTLELTQQFLKQNPDSLRACLDQATALATTFQYVEACQAYQQALQLCEEQGQNPGAVYGLLGQLEQQRGRFDVAAEHFASQIQHAAEDAAGYLQLGALQLQEGNPNDAEATIRRALDCESNDPAEIRYSIGLCQLARNELLRAKASFQTAADRDPDFAAASRSLKDVKSAISARRNSEQP